MGRQIDKQDKTDVPSNYVTAARISEIRKKMLHGAVNGTRQQHAIAAEIWHEDLPDVLETLERTQRGDFTQKPSAMDCFGRRCPRPWWTFVWADGVYGIDFCGKL